MFSISKPRTVAAAIAPLLKAASDLENVVTVNADEIAANNTAIERLTANNTEALFEQNHATRVLAALRGITNPIQE